MNTDSTDSNSIGKINRRKKERVLPPEFAGKVRLNESGSWEAADEKTEKPSYPQNWPLYNRAQTHEKLLFYQILNDAVNSMDIEEKVGGRGRPYHLMRDMLKACVIKVFVGFSSRRTISELKLVQKLGYVRNVPHYNSIVNYFGRPEVQAHLTVLYKMLAMPMRGIEKRFAADATGFSTTMKTDWVSFKFGAKRGRWKWKKLHIVTGVESNVIAAAEVTNERSNDSPQFCGLVGETARSFSVQEVMADAGYLSKNNVDFAAGIGATPYIMPRRDVHLRGRGSQAWKRMIRLWQENRDEFKRHYHARSNVESTFSMMKRKFSGGMRNRKDQSQVNEILCKVVCHNISVLVSSIFELGIELDWS